MSIETAKCPRGHVISFRRPWWRAVAPMRTAAIAHCARCRSEAFWGRRQPDDEATFVATGSVMSNASTPSVSSAPEPDRFVSGGGGVFDGGGASGRWEAAPLASNAWSTGSAAADDIAPAPAPSCDAPTPAPAYESPAPSPSDSGGRPDSGSCSASDSGSSDSGSSSSSDS